MSRATFRLVLLVSCAHALVHIFELSLPSVEQMIGDMITFSVGGLVPMLAGMTPAANWPTWTFGALAVVSVAAAVLTLMLPRQYESR